MSETYNEGDLVEAVKDDAVVRGRIAERLGGLVIDLDAVGGWSLGHLGHIGFTLTVIEKAAPKLPTEPGFYLDRGGDVWELNQHGWLVGGDDQVLTFVHGYAPFTRLEPVPETAKKVLDEVAKFAWADGFAPALEKVAKQFGATP